jgi:hypothetical protein
MASDDGIGVGGNSGGDEAIVVGIARHCAQNGQRRDADRQIAIEVDARCLVKREARCSRLKTVRYSAMSYRLPRPFLEPGVARLFRPTRAVSAVPCIRRNSPGVNPKRTRNRLPKWLMSRKPQSNAMPSIVCRP